MLWCAALATAGAVAAAEPRSYTVLLSGNVAGRQVVSDAADGTIRIEFEFTDRGRGPKVSETVRLDDEGLPVELEIAGNDYLKNAVSETFRRDAAGRGSWQSSIEQGESTEAGGFYVSFNGAPYESALLADALSRRSDHSLPLLPVGRATLEMGPERVVESAAGQEVVRPAVLTGLGFEPSTVWLDRRGELFAIADAWFSVVRSGWESTLEPLLAVQREASTRRWRKVAEQCSHRPSGALVIRHARLFDSATLLVHDGWTIVVDGERIVAVGRDGDVAEPPGAEIVDAGGRTVLPGLWDMHTHLGELDGPLDLAAGVTTVRDLANDVDALGELRRQWDSGETLGPRVVAAGFLDGPGPFAGPSKALVDTVEAGKEWIERYAGLGYRQIKLYSSLKPELVAPLAAEAHRRGLRVSGHVPSGMIAEQAVIQGYDEIQHINMLVLGLFPEIVETRTPARFTEVAARAAGVDPKGEPFQHLVGVLRDHGTVIDPTVGILEGMFLDRPGVVSGEIAAVADRLPPQVVRGYLAGGTPVPDGMDETYRRSAQRLLDLVAELHRSGVPIVAGTDSLAGFALHRELEHYVAAGIPAPEVLRIATLGAATVMGMNGDLGRVAPGKVADFILVEGRPDERIAEIRRVRTVVQRGRVIDPAALYAAVGVAPEP